jgi:hypothetical protein
VVPGDGEVLVYYVPTKALAGSAAFAAYCWDDAGNVWFAMSDSNSDGAYEVAIPENYKNIIFVALNSASMDWANKVAQTGDLTVPADNNNAYLAYSDTWTTLADALAFEEPTDVCKLVVKVAKELDWYDKYIYSWTSGSTTGAWPGTKMEYIGEEGNYYVYFFNFPYSLNGKKIDFVVSAGAGDGQPQTNDLSVVLNGAETVVTVEVTDKK